MWEIAKKVNEFMSSYFNKVDMESPIVPFWFLYLEIVEIFFLHYHSMRDQNWEEYLLSMRLMMPCMSPYDVCIMVVTCHCTGH